MPWDTVEVRHLIGFKIEVLCWLNILNNPVSCIRQAILQDYGQISGHNYLHFMFGLLLVAAAASKISTFKCLFDLFQRPIRNFPLFYHLF